MSFALKKYLHENVMLAFAPTLHEDLNHGLQQKKNLHLQTPLERMQMKHNSILHVIAILIC